MPSAVPGRTSNATYGMPRTMRLEAPGVGRVQVAVAPRADGLHAVVALAEREPGALSGLRTCSSRSMSAARSGTTTSPVAPRSTSGSPLGRWNCAIPALTHISRAPVLTKNGSRGQPQPRDVVVRGERLVADAHVDVPETDDVAEILGRAIELRVRVRHGVPSRVSGGDYVRELWFVPPADPRIVDPP